MITVFLFWKNLHAYYPIVFFQFPDEDTWDLEGFRLSMYQVRASRDVQTPAHSDHFLQTWTLLGHSAGAEMSRCRVDLNSLVELVPQSDGLHAFRTFGVCCL